MAVKGNRQSNCIAASSATTGNCERLLKRDPLRMTDKHQVILAFLTALPRLLFSQQLDAANNVDQATPHGHTDG